MRSPGDLPPGGGGAAGGSDPAGVTRRAFLAGVASAALVGCGPKADPPVSGGFADDGGAAGHRIRDGVGDASPPPRSERAGVVVVGAGIAGLSAAWWLDRAGYSDFVVLEMDRRPGGNARWGEGRGGPFPWAAHYVPVPGPRATLLRELLRDVGALRDGGWNEEMRVYAPEERLFRWGRWSLGLEESLVETRAERDEMRRFQDLVAARRASGEFTIPSADGAPEASALDRMSMGRWLDEHGFRTEALRWYVDYCCRDDYGAAPADVSAWAGIHYFAAREEHGAPLAWPEGNGWVVKRLLEGLGGRVRTGHPVRRVEAEGRGARVVAGDVAFECDAVVWAAPSFVAVGVVDGAPPVDFEYSPWVTAAVTVERPPRELGAPPAWDNVIHRSSSLGYVVGRHQTLETAATWPRVWTWYTTMEGLPPRKARELLLGRSWAGWRDLVLADLARAHPDIRSCVSRVEVMRMGHAMVRPTPGFLSSPARRALGRADGPVVYGHSDLSGLSLFEEAQHRGVVAAERVLARLGGREERDVAAVPPDGGRPGGAGAVAGDRPA